MPNPYNVGDVVYSAQGKFRIVKVQGDFLLVRMKVFFVMEGRPGWVHYTQVCRSPEEKKYMNV